MDRRDALFGVLALVPWPGAARAQPAARIPRIGVLSGAADASQFPERHTIEALGELGWIDGRTAAYEYRHGRNDAGLLTRQAGELAGLPLNVIIAFSAGVNAAMGATRAIPIVFGTSQNPVSAGYVASLGRPGGNLTGATFLTDELAAKRLELLKESVRGAARIAVLWDPAHHDLEFKGMQAAASRIGLQVQSVEISRPARPDEAERGIRAAREARAEAIVLSPSGFTIANRRRLAALAAEHRIPVFSAWRIFAEEGAVLTYGPDLREITRRIASHVDRILKGAKPDELPVERPTKFELVINLKAARAIGLSLPQGVLLRADAVIE